MIILTSPANWSLQKCQLSQISGFHNNSSYGGFSCILGLVRAVWLKLKCQRRMIKSQEVVIKKPTSLCFLSFVEEKRQRDWRVADPV